MRLGDENRGENETDERREERLEGARARQTIARENESDESREVRLENDRMRQVNVRQNEDDENRQIRLINNRVRIPRTYNMARRPITDEISA